MIEVNFVIRNENLKKNEDLLPALFGDWDGNIQPPITFVNEPVDMYDLLVTAGIFKSRGDAKKNWKQIGKEIPNGFSDFTVGKLHNRITIWKPI